MPYKERFLIEMFVAFKASVNDQTFYYSKPWVWKTSSMKSDWKVEKEIMTCLRAPISKREDAKLRLFVKKDEMKLFTSAMKHFVLASGPIWTETSWKKASPVVQLSDFFTLDEKRRPEYYFMIELFKRAIFAATCEDAWFKAGVPFDDVPDFHLGSCKIRILRYGELSK